MASQLEQDIKAFNREAFRRELTNAMIIKSQIKGILDDQVNTGESHHTVLNAVDECLFKMLTASNLESYNAHENRLKHLVNAIENRAGLQTDKTDVTKEFKNFQIILKAVKNNQFEDRQNLMSAFDESVRSSPVFDRFQIQLKSLSNADSKVQHEKIQTLILNELLHYEKESDLTNQAAAGLIDRNLNLLNESRNIYLKQETSYKRVLKDVAWSGAGALMIVGASVLAIGFPLLTIPGIVVGAGVMTYGALDLAKEIVSEDETMKLGTRQIEKEDMDDLKTLAQHAPGFDVDKMLEYRDKVEHQRENKEKSLKRFGLGMSVLGLTLGVVALVTLIPALALPIAGVAVIAGLSMAVAGVAAGLTAYKAYQTKQEVSETQIEALEQSKKDLSQVDALSFQNDMKGFISSTQQIMHDEIANSPTASVHEMMVPQELDNIDAVEDLDDRISPKPEKTPTILSSPKPSVSDEERPKEDDDEGEGESIRGPDFHG